MRFADILVDLAAVASASRSVARQHVALRARQIERYGRESTVARDVLRKNQRPPAPSAPGGQTQAGQQPQEQEQQTEAPGSRHEGQGAETVELLPHEQQQIRPQVDGKETSASASVPASATEANVQPNPEAATGAGTGSAAEKIPANPSSPPQPPADLSATTSATTTPTPPTPTPEPFVPAPWANGSIALLKQGFVAPKRPPPSAQELTSKILKKPLGPGVDMQSLFRTKRGSGILEALKGAEAELETEVTRGQEVKEEVDAIVEARQAAEVQEEVQEDASEAGTPKEETVKASGVVEEQADRNDTLPRARAGEEDTPQAAEPAAEPTSAPEEVAETSTKTNPEPAESRPVGSAPAITLEAAETEPSKPSPLEPGSAASQREDTMVESSADLAPPPLASGAPGYQLRESAVPSSRISRLWNYGGLAAGMVAGAIGEGLSRAVGGGSGSGSVMLSPANMERLVAKLSRMRGAALKLGQMMSFQDAKMLPPPIQEVLQRVQDRADYMPAWQRDRVLTANLGADWRDLFSEFEDKPIAAASIGQVHRAVLRKNGAPVAVKIQFPGVADSINSDLDNLAILLNATKLLPKGLYLDKTIANARTELAWECDYEREAGCAERYRQLLMPSSIADPDSSPNAGAPLADDPAFAVPRVYREASGKHVLTMEFMRGTAVTRMVPSLTQSQRDWIGTQILRLCLREITEFHFMQTDPNWTNFLYNPATNRLELLDFGASREYPDEFISTYLRLLEAAARADRDAVRDLSKDLGYLTGHESRAMLDAHVTSVVTLAEPFLQSAPEVYDFRGQTITERVKAQIPVMIRERLAPPPEETYSLHRKLSGAFLLCARLGSRVRCRELFEEALVKAGFRK
ncbi:hypothetical protein VTJ83DRAFT_3407 [Remersonia thermophila]|uniref:ABC1 atypical kinase-like domain-containing protein n=1 Tax=Remersonia thermophila TaxID=72144 RepID=A0ABR4DDX6_9PEZI